MDTTNINYDEKDIVESYLRGETQLSIAERLGTYNTTIRRILIRNKVVFRTHDQSYNKIKTNKFKDGSEYAEYFLGYLIADGCIGNTTKKGYFNYYINLSTMKDPEMLNIYKAWVGTPNKVRSYPHHKYGTMQYSVTYSHKETWEYLVSLGITPKKSLDINLTRPLSRHMLRGIFDGDGCVYLLNKKRTHKGKPACSIATASKKLADNLFNFLSAFNPTLSVSKINRKNPLYSVNIFRFEYVKKFYAYLYDDATVFLERKKDKFRSTTWETS